MSYNRMRSQSMNIMDSIDRLDVSQTPNYKFTLALCNRLKADGMPVLVAERVVCRMPITITTDAADDTELMTRVVDVYSSLIQRLLQQIQQDFETDAHELLEILVAQMGLKLEF